MAPKQAPIVFLAKREQGLWLSVKAVLTDAMTYHAGGWQGAHRDPAASTAMRATKGAPWAQKAGGTTPLCNGVGGKERQS